MGSSSGYLIYAIKPKPIEDLKSIIKVAFANIDLDL